MPISRSRYKLKRWPKCHPMGTAGPIGREYITSFQLHSCFSLGLSICLKSYDINHVDRKSQRLSSTLVPLINVDAQSHNYCFTDPKNVEKYNQKLFLEYLLAFQPHIR